MATEGGFLEHLTFQAAADLREFQHRFVRPTGAGTINVASDSGAAAASEVIGVLTSKPNSGEHCSVAWLGKTKVVVGGAITANRFITTQGSGKAAHAASGDLVIGRALTTGGAEDEKIEALIFPPFRLGNAN